MKMLMVALASISTYTSIGWNSIQEMDSAICIALTNDNYIASSNFINQLKTAACSNSAEMRTEAYMMLSLSAYQNFLNTADEKWLAHEMSNASNAVYQGGCDTNTWQYWSAKLIYMGAFVSQSDFTNAYSIATNALFDMNRAVSSNTNSVVEHAILQKFEMPELTIEEAIKVMAAMSAFEIGRANVSTNYANQLPPKYRDIIFEFIKK